MLDNICKSCFSNMNNEKKCPVCGYSEETYEYDNDALKIGTVLNGRYLIGKELGSGGFGITYLAYCVKDNKRYTIKEYFPNEISRRNNSDHSVYPYTDSVKSVYAYGKSKFIEEGRLIKSLSNCKYVREVISWFEENSTAYLVMEYLEGGTLKEYLDGKPQKKISWIETEKIIVSLISALKMVHKTGLIHRDISPDNIFVTIDFEVMFIDFGAARYETNNKSKSISVIMKKGYSPIEQYSSGGKQGAWTDIYSFCATVYKCLTSITPQEPVDRIIQDKLKTPIELGIDIPKSTNDAIMKGMNIDYKNRQQNIKQLESEMFDYKQNKKSRSKNKKSRSKRRKPIILSASLIILLSLVAILFWNPMKYQKAINKMDSKKYDEAIKLFESMPNYKNSLVLIKESNYQKAEDYYADEKYKEVIELLEGMKDYEDSNNVIEMSLDGLFDKGVGFYDAYGYRTALDCFMLASDHGHSESKYYIAKCLEYGNGVKQDDELALKWYKHAAQYGSEDAVERLDEIRLADRIEKRGNNVIDVGDGHSVVLLDDGELIAKGYNKNGQCDVIDWSNIISVSVGSSHTVGLKNDGTVIAVGFNNNKRCNVDGWDNIVKIEAGSYHTVGLKDDGTVIAVGDAKSNGEDTGRCKVELWTDIVDIAAGYTHTVGLKSDGTVVAAGKTEYETGGEEVGSWSNIVAISAGRYHTIGLKDDGTVVVAGKNNKYGQCDVDNWEDIVAVSAGEYHTIGLKSDGTIVATGLNESGQCDVVDWEEIYEVKAGGENTIAMKNDGSILVVGDNEYGQCDMLNW